MRFGVAFANGGPLAEGPVAVACARAIEAAGFDSVWTIEHVLVPSGYESTYPYARSGKMPGGETVPMPDPLVWLAYIASATETLLLGTGIVILPQRNPAILAKEVATLDRMSGGRLRLGVGVGWLEEEFAALGVPFAGRGKRLDAYVAAMRALWTGEPVDLDDGYHVWHGAISLPAPAGASVPIVVGGHTEVAARRAGRLGDGFFPGKGTPEQIAHLVSVMRQAAEEAGRDPAAIEVTAGSRDLGGPDPIGAIEHMASIGVHRLVIPPLAFDAESAPAAYAAFGDAIIAKA
ncbi:LLM class F420-dependent oxidoreductase [Aquihabitans sp. McL0605]|uniref:LLM class F420-dependent oxidoreductase n=1 Tax=Aquihabitans sp. McL0605 TaxID=3415671 RepID=UPI003CFA59B8